MTGLRDLVRLLVKGRPEGIRRRLLRRLFRQPRTSPQEQDAPTPPQASASAGTVLAKEEDLVDGEVLEVMLAGEPVALCRVDGVVYALDGTCPHAGGPLADGTLVGTVISCPYHGWSFDVRTGECQMDDDLRAQPVAVVVRDGVIRAVDGRAHD